VAIIYLSFAWIAGIFLGSKFHLPLVSLLFGLIPLPLIIPFRKYIKQVILASLCLIVFAGGAIYFQVSLPEINENHLQFYNDREIIEIKGIVASEPEIGDRTAQLHFSASEIEVDGLWHQVSGTALLIIQKYPTYNYGDVLLVRGKLTTPTRFDDFDYRAYLAQQDVYSTMLYPSIEVLTAGQGAKPLEWLYSIRDRLSRSITRVLPEPQASLAQGIVLGLRGNISSSLKDDFINTGTAHILVISGVNLTIVAGILVSLGLWLFGRRHYIYIWLALGMTWLYALLTGVQPPVLRAAIMVSLFLVADLLGRQRSAVIALVLAAAIMVGISPRVLWYPSFQLSFASMAGLIFVVPPLQSLGKRGIKAALGEDGKLVSTANLINDSFSVSLGAVLAVLPLIIYYFGIISWIGPLATFFALPALPGIIITGALIGFFGLFALPLAQVIGWIAWLFLSYMLLVVRVFAMILPTSIEGSSTGIAFPLIYYLGLALLLWLNAQRKKLGEFTSGVTQSLSRLSPKWVIPSLSVVAILVWLIVVTMPDDRLHVSFLDVGQGDAILIQRGSQQILIDGGPSPQAINLGLSGKMPFWDRTIELVVLTHPHADHLAGLVEVLNRYKIQQVLQSGIDYDSPLYKEWLSLLDKNNIICKSTQAGQQIDLGNSTMIEVLNPQVPPLTGTDADEDNNSVVMRLEIGKVSFLLTADITRLTELELVSQRASLATTVLKVAHHGSEAANTPEFLAITNPYVAVISAGRDNPFGHPDTTVVSQLKDRPGSENIYRTDEHGTIEFITDGERLWVRVEKPSKK
jgi:competence protein ComEC